MTPLSLTPAAQYLRVSHGNRDCPLEIQQTVIEEYARQHDFVVVRTYSDVGKSGLKLRPRHGFRDLLQDVISGGARYRAVLVYDIPRWGRFQNTDEAAYYEFLCKSFGISVHYCAEKFPNDASPQSVIHKSLKRLMAAQYSRQLSDRCFRGQKRLAECGFRVGGPAGYAFRRMVVGQDGRPKNILKSGEYKTLATDRIVLIPGMRTEVEQVREMYRLVIQGRKTPTEIAAALNCRAVPRHDGKKWSRAVVKDILTNPKYAGLNVWNRRSMRLHGSVVHNDYQEWVTRAQAFAPLIPMREFERVQQILRKMTANRSQGELLSKLKDCLSTHRKLTRRLIATTPGLPSDSTYARRFGTLQSVYGMLGYTPDGRFMKSDNFKRTKLFQDTVVKQLFELYGKGITVSRGIGDNRLMLRLKNGLTIAVRVCSKVANRSGNIRWRLYRGVRSQSEHLDLICLLNETNDRFYRFYLVPPISPKPIKRFLVVNDAILTSGLQVRDLALLLEAADCLIHSAMSRC